MLKQEEPLGPMQKRFSSILWIIENLKVFRPWHAREIQLVNHWKSESVFSQRNPFHQMSPFNGPSVIIARSAGLIHFYKLQQRSEMVGIFFSCAVNIYDQIGFLNFLKLSPICAMCAICEMCAYCLMPFYFQFLFCVSFISISSFLPCFMHFKLYRLLHVIVSHCDTFTLWLTFGIYSV